ncbi:hypothetical protein PHLCEN_2v11511 [Hermanssonia centrifuga]|uniref:F-box domain-containing protein n=1 Tax=Hermanssonia centrifuga TaxID=98765 RepID=A0A2R6NJS0_9APHY|nr:hypothetical protein PHLCEN_2v11511 [Hermanssonia centrifuga]
MSHASSSSSLDCTTKQALESLTFDIQQLRDMQEETNSRFTQAITLLQLRQTRLHNAEKIPLPEDIVRVIFEYVAIHEHDCRMSLGFSCWRSVLAISQTCAHWRFISLTNPLMWSRIDYTQLPLFLGSLFFTRSDQCALHIATKIASIPSDNDWIEPIFPRLKTLAIEFVNSKDLVTLIRQRVPLLETCFLKSSAQIQVPIFEGPFHNKHVSNIFGSEAPRLRNLCMSGIRMPWAPGQYVGLRSLHINTDGAMSINDQNILTIFRDSPLLEDLDLRHIQPLHWTSLPVDPTLIPLRSLRRLKLTMKPADQLRILSSIITPPTMDLLHITAINSAWAWIDEGYLIPFPADSRCLPPLHTMQSLCLDLRHPCISGCSKPGHPSMWFIAGTSYSEPGLERVFLRDLQVLRSVYSLASLTEFTLIGSVYNFIKGEDIVPLLKVAPNITSFALENVSSDIVDELANPSHALRAFFGNLTAFTLKHMLIQASTMLTILHPGPDALKKLVKLHFCSCNFSAETASLAREQLQSIRQMNIGDLIVENAKLVYPKQQRTRASSTRQTWRP